MTKFYSQTPQGTSLKSNPLKRVMMFEKLKIWLILWYCVLNQSHNVCYIKVIFLGTIRELRNNCLLGNSLQECREPAHWDGWNENLSHWRGMTEELIHICRILWLCSSVRLQQVFFEHRTKRWKRYFTETATESEKKHMKLKKITYCT